MCCGVEDSVFKIMFFSFDNVWSYVEFLMYLGGFFSRGAYFVVDMAF